MRQRLGQNFLVDQNIARKIIAAAELSPEDRVIEVGPGKGVLTSLIAPLVRELTAVELDRTLAAALSERYPKDGRVEIRSGDFLDYRLEEVPAPVKIVANLPYYVSTAIIEKILPHPNWSLCVVMVQKEVGERLAAHPRTKAYGAFSILCQYYASVEPVLMVSPGAFFPRPSVDSVVLRLSNRRPPPPDPELFPFIRLAFLQRRKTIANSLAHGLGLPKPVLLEALAAAGIPDRARPEVLRFEEFAALLGEVKKRAPQSPAQG